MVYISRLKLRNFKSFKAADVQLPQTFICFAGPNGSGKSNLCDAIRFAMGEKSLRSLRAKKVKDLIYAGSKSAEVILHFSSENGGESYEIKRAIREDGKIKYRLNGKRTTRNSILETLKKHSLDESGRNTIAQGEVQRLINMNGKERRGIIDSVAGIADFEAKKKEAIGELQTVDGRIREARVILGERRVFLDELGREKEVAIRYTDSKKKLTDAKGTLIKREVQRLEKELEETAAKDSKLAAERHEKEQAMAGVERGISELDAKRAQTSAEMQSKQKTNALIRRLEELKASIGSRKQMIKDREDALVSLGIEHRKLKAQIAADKDAVEAVEKELETLKGSLAEAEKALAAAGGQVEDEGLSSLRRSLDAKEEELSSARERLLLLESEISAKRELIEAKMEEERGILPREFEQEEAEDIEFLKREVGKLSGELERSFKRIKEINAKMAELDRELLELKEKASIHKVRASPQLANPALSFIANLKDNHPGIYGTVAELITFDTRYAHAVEAAGGGRLMYVVVDSVDTATGVIDKLKRAKAGRATFIPLDTIRTPHPAKAGGFGSVLEVIEARNEVRRAAEFVFADTLLIDSPEDAKKLGIGSARMVTESGEIFERS
ncbi:MAG: AAA family ATPase, partial [Candidatus Micrarchaeota archaeon]